MKIDNNDNSNTKSRDSIYASKMIVTATAVASTMSTSSSVSVKVPGKANPLSMGFVKLEHPCSTSDDENCSRLSNLWGKPSTTKIICPEKSTNLAVDVGSDSSLKKSINSNSLEIPTSIKTSEQYMKQMKEKFGNSEFPTRKKKLVEMLRLRCSESLFNPEFFTWGRGEPFLADVNTATTVTSSFVTSTDTALSSFASNYINFPSNASILSQGNNNNNNISIYSILTSTSSIISGSSSATVDFNAGGLNINCETSKGNNVNRPIVVATMDTSCYTDSAATTDASTTTNINNCISDINTSITDTNSSVTNTTFDNPVNIAKCNNEPFNLYTNASIAIVSVSKNTTFATNTLPASTTTATATTIATAATTSVAADGAATTAATNEVPIKIILKSYKMRSVMELVQNKRLNIQAIKLLLTSQPNVTASDSNGERKVPCDWSADLNKPHFNASQIPNRNLRKRYCP
ncbi:hypothetical protein HELRODRAFT_180168 [Helobdella robusta]|uniref:Uncharacterized protein n=1 Tax=Helobdella robusta TaxID=6412 RepID=T1FFJ4_HELRO|nr:hypothetical protein HELRODRAFT_180168 [Helobdella robusta]ESN94816.1 hypothetical protein HELRODRAFT_180168 [Helobdella robusta]